MMQRMELSLSSNENFLDKYSWPNERKRWQVKRNMESLIYDFRYPFDSALEFFAGFYFLKLEALHLTIGYLLLSYMIVRVFSNRHLPLSYKFAIIYFAGTIFNNPAYQIGVTISEIFGEVQHIDKKEAKDLPMEETEWYK